MLEIRLDCWGEWSYLGELLVLSGVLHDDNDSVGAVGFADVGYGKDEKSPHRPWLGCSLGRTVSVGDWPTMFRR